MDEKTFKLYKGLLVASFPILGESYPFSQLIENGLSDERQFAAGALAKEHNLYKVTEALIKVQIEKRLRNEIVPDYWSHFQELPASYPNKFKLFYLAINKLHQSFLYLRSMLEKLDRFCAPFVPKRYNLTLALQSSLFAQLQVNYEGVIRDFYETALRLDDPNEEEHEGCFACYSQKQQCNCLSMFQETNQKLNEISLLEPLCGQTLTNLIYSYIHNHIEKTCKDKFQSSKIYALTQWLENFVVKWLNAIYKEDSADVLKKKLVNFLYNSYTKIRIDQLFDIIIEYPDSFAALQDLQICLPKTDLKPFLIKKLQRALETRLLHPGVSTPDVLTAYISAIRSLRMLDSTGLLLETVTQPVHQYLRSREDTVRCVVSSLTEEGPNDLADELCRGEAEDEEEEEAWENWTPDPVDSIPNKALTSSKRTSDIISMLVNVYGSKELFVNEYRTLLADRLLSQYTCDTEKEIRYLELLKLRFGDSQLNYCEVMLKDIADSKRINQNIKQEPAYSSEFPLSALIVSAQFWPPFKEEKLAVHKVVQEQMEGFTKGFEVLKGSRTLCWKNHLGVVDLEVELGDRTLSLAVSPVHATILLHFQDENTWSLEDLSKVMQCPPTVLRRKISFWQSHGVLVEVQGDVFQVQDAGKREGLQEDIFVEDLEAESAMASAQDQREEELQTFWSYIVGMLMNLDTLPLDRIHQMLKMFAFQGPTIECSLQELKVFLDRKVREHHLIYSNGFYKLPK